MKTLNTLIAAAVLTVSGITIANADAAMEARSETVGFADLDTTNVHGAAALYRRIASAAESVCRDLKPGRQLVLMEPYVRCVHQAISAAVTKVDRPAVTAYSQARGGHSPAAAIKLAGNN
jgi:UrcA family protein